MNARAAVIGAGANELVAAHLLARAGRSVVVLDPHERPAEERTTVGWVAPRLARELGLERHGFALAHADPWLQVAVDGGRRLELWNDVQRSAESIRPYSANDAARWPDFCARMARLASGLEALALAPPPDPLGRGIGALAQLGGRALRLRRLGKQGLEDLLRTAPMPVADLLDDWFECDALKAALGAAGIAHLHQGPRSGGTALNLLQQHVGCAPGVFRAPLSNLERVLSALPGIEIRCGAKPARIEVRDGRSTGVRLESGEQIDASLVLSGIDPRRTLLGLLGPEWLEPELVRSVRNIRARGVVAQLLLKLDRAPGFSTLAIAPSLDGLERAYDDAKYGGVSQRPVLEAQADDRTVRVHVQYAPYALAAGSWDSARRDELAARVLQTLDAHVPGFSSTVSDRTVLSPPELERVHGWPEGQFHHAEPALDQWLWMRPTPELARYRTPIRGLYLCGAAMHPGAWLPGACGYHAARQALKDVRERSMAPS